MQQRLGDIVVDVAMTRVFLLIKSFTRRNTIIPTEFAKSRKLMCYLSNLGTIGCPEKRKRMSALK